MQITLGGKKLNATLDARGKHVQIARVKLNQKERLEPLSLLQVLGHLDQHIDGILACSPCNNVQGLLSPHTIIDDSTKVPVLLRNMSTKPINQKTKFHMVEDCKPPVKWMKVFTSTYRNHIVDLAERSTKRPNPRTKPLC